MPEENQLKSYQEKIIKLMIEQESALADLYRSFAAQFPRYGEFWGRMAMEEEKHAGWLQQLYDAAKQDIVLFSEGKIKTYTMEIFIKGMKENIERAQCGGFTVQRALAYTNELERSLIERDVFTHFSGMSDKARSIMERLNRETKRHQVSANKLYLEDRATGGAGRTPGQPG